MDNTNIFIKKADNIHKSYYDYSLVNYINNKTDIVIMCPEHGDFKQKPHIHLDKSGYPKCNLESRIKKTINNTSEFIKKAIVIHINKYTYELTNYTKALNHIIITCPKHGDFKQTPNKHLLGRRCSICSRESKWANYDEVLLKYKVNIYRATNGDFTLVESTNKALKIVSEEISIYKRNNIL